MLVIRPVLPGDVDAILHLASLTGYGLTTLPNDRKIILRRIQEARRGFERMEEAPRGESYFFVMEDVSTGRIGGTCGIVSKVGGFEPFYAYEVRTAVHESDSLGVRKEIRTLHLVEEHNGPCEIGSLFLAPEFRGGGRGRFLSLARFLFMAEHPDYFDPIVIAEMRGVIDAGGRSPFWDALGRHFFEVEFPTADALSFQNKKFIADLMPKHPIYIPLLPREAQEVIGKVNDATRPALSILEREGFEFNGMVDIFEAGPVIQAHRDSIRTVRESRRAAIVEIRELPANTEPMLVCSTVPDFRAIMTPLSTVNGGVRLAADGAAALNVSVGSTVRYVAL